MSELFLTLINMSITASWLVLCVLLLRILLKKAPKWLRVALWGLVGLRLALPFSIESVLSLIPSAETISPGIIYSETPAIQSGIPALNSTLNPIISGSFAPTVGDSANPLQIWVSVASVVWLAGIAALLIYAAASYLRLHARLKTAIPLRENIYQSENAASPFVLGLLRPRIYLPFYMPREAMESVIAHERAHIKRRDHIIKPIGYLLLCVYWFNPLLWAAYILLCRDIELACDERVIGELEPGERADYSEALLSCSAPHRRMVMACPLAFGEVGVKERVKNVLNYKKPAFWVIIVAVVACVIVGVCFLTNPKTSSEFPMEGTNISNLDPQRTTDSIAAIVGLDDSSQLYVNTDNFDLTLNSDFDWTNAEAIRFFYTKNSSTSSAQLRLFFEEKRFFVTDSTNWPEQDSAYKLQHYLEALKYLPQDRIRQLSADADRYQVIFRDNGSPDDYERVIAYTPNGERIINGWYIHLELQPLRKQGDAYHGTGNNSIHLFYGAETSGLPVAAKLSLHDAIALSKKGEKLTWTDFADYSYTETGSGLYIRVYEIDEQFSLWIGGGSTDESPMYIRLVDKRDDTAYIDIRTADVETFIADRQALASVSEVGGVDGPAHVAESSDPLDAAMSAAILEHHKDGYLRGSFACESHILLASESGAPAASGYESGSDTTVYYLLVAYREYTYESGRLKVVSGGQIPTALTFAASGSGEYTLTEYWEPRDGSFYPADIRKKFPESAASSALNPGSEVERLQIACDEKAMAHYLSAFAASGGAYSADASGADRAYIMSESQEAVKPCISLHGDGSFSFTFSALSSYLKHGLYFIDNEKLTLKTDDGSFTYVFDMVDNTLIFRASDSSEQTRFSGMKDGSVFL